jgi:hypothetical protein
MATKAFLQRGQDEEAVAIWRRAAGSEPDSERHLYNLACVLARCGRVAEALETLEAAVDRGWTDADWMEKDGDLESLRDQGRYKALLEKIRTSPK